MAVIIGARAHDFPYCDPETLFSAISAAGYESVQLACPKSFKWSYPLTGEQAGRVVSCQEKYGISIAVLGCYVEVASEDRETRLDAVKTYIEALKTAKDIGAFCVGTETTFYRGSEPERHKAFERLTDSTLRMAEAAEKFNVDMGIEPVFGHTLATPELACELKYKVGSTHLKWIWDAVNLLDPADNDPVYILQKRTAELIGDDIVAMHVKDAAYRKTKSKDDRPLFEGDFDWTYPFKWAAHQNSMFILREHAIPQRSRAEIEGMKRLLTE